MDEPWNANIHYDRRLDACVPETARSVLDVGCGDGFLAARLARRLTHSPGVGLLSAAAMGAALLAGAHLLSLSLSQVFRPVPVGLITVCLGGLYLIWLLIREARK